MPKPFLYACAVRFIHEKALHHDYDWIHRRERHGWLPLQTHRTACSFRPEILNIDG